MNASRKPLIAGNWKMFHGDRSGVTLAAECAKIARATAGVDLLIAPPYTALAARAAECREKSLAAAAQNLHASEQSACTGEISAATIRDAGCTWVILGHSERRHFLAESDELVAEKLAAALEVGLRPIACVGRDARTARGGTRAPRNPPAGRCGVASPGGLESPCCTRL
jgi:triosephosphate isomerase